LRRGAPESFLDTSCFVVLARNQRSQALWSCVIVLLMRPVEWKIVPPEATASGPPKDERSHCDQRDLSAAFDMGTIWEQ
jgi:hypothetical protein